MKMRIYRQTIELTTNKKTQFIDITDKINEVIAQSRISEGIAFLQTMHTTTGIILNEAEPNALDDIVEHLEKHAPFNAGYRHDNPLLRKDCPEDEPKNCDAHIKSSCYSNSSIMISVSKRKLELGKYQRVIFQEFDGPCPRKHKSTRKYLVKIIGI